MARSSPRVALFGGTFDPIHLGHLAVATTALGCGLVDEVRFIPAGQPPHKAGPRHSAEERWLMTVLATLDEPRFRVERWEIDRPGRSYAVDTLREAKAALDGAELYWVIGADAMALIHTWREAPALFELARFLVISRDGLSEVELRATLADTAPWMAPEAMIYMPMPPVPISSTALRERLGAGADVTDSLPPLVGAYIGRYGLYRTAQEAGL